MKLTTKWIL